MSPNGTHARFFRDALTPSGVKNDDRVVPTLPPPRRRVCRKPGPAVLTLALIGVLLAANAQGGDRLWVDLPGQVSD